MDYTNLGVGAIAALLILREVFNFINFRRNSSSNGFNKQLSDLWEWHNVRDEDGVPVWYVRHSLGPAIEKLSTSIDNQTIVMQNMMEILREIKYETSRVLTR